MDLSTFRGKVFQDEETRFIYKEGTGQLVRTVKGERNFCYYKRITGNWSRGILHGKRIEYDLNLDVFPKGYL